MWLSLLMLARSMVMRDVDVMSVRRRRRRCEMPLRQHVLSHARDRFIAAIVVVRHRRYLPQRAAIDRTDIDGQ